MQDEEAKRLMIDCFMAGVRATHPESCLKGHLPKAPDKGKIILLAGGKAAGAMLKVAVQHFLKSVDKERITGIAVHHHDGDWPLFHMEQIRAGHPVPDENSQKGALRVLELAGEAGEGDLVVVLLSGGASALWSAPVEGVSLAQKQQLTRDLLRSGASIHEMNCVRKHLSKIKGGRLALAARPAKLVTLAISDVVGDDPAVIGSGPTIGDPSTLAEARLVLERFRLLVPQNMRTALDDPLNETPKPDEAVFVRNSWHCIANGATALGAAGACLLDKGYEVIDLGDGIQGEARDVALEHVAVALRARTQGSRIALLSGGELTVSVTGSGKGGPSQEYALALAMALEGAKGISALAGDSDGCDGGQGKTDDPAGAFVFPSTLLRAEAKQLKPATFLDNNDAGTFFKRLGDLLVIGPTFTNVNDLRIILINN